MLFSRESAILRSPYLVGPTPGPCVGSGVRSTLTAACLGRAASAGVVASPDLARPQRLGGRAVMVDFAVETEPMLAFRRGLRALIPANRTVVTAAAIAA